MFIGFKIFCLSWLCSLEFVSRSVRIFEVMLEAFEVEFIYRTLEQVLTGDDAYVRLKGRMG